MNPKQVMCVCITYSPSDLTQGKCGSYKEMTDRPQCASGIR